MAAAFPSSLASLPLNIVPTQFPASAQTQQQQRVSAPIAEPTKPALATTNVATTSNLQEPAKKWNEPESEDEAHESEERNDVGSEDEYASD